MDPDEKIINITIPFQVQKILDILQDAGHEACIVGGCVRDYLLGRVPGDWDITTSALPSEVKSLFFHTVDTGIQHGTVMVLMGGSGFEVTTYRKDGAYSDCRRPDHVEFTPSLEEDLKRRDFTINALAYNPSAGLVDLFGGISDLEHGIIRCVGDPDKRFSEDALRIMRAVRFAAQLSFQIEEDTCRAICAHADNLAKISMERIRVEFEKTLLSDNPGDVNRFQELGLASGIIRNAASLERCFCADSVPLYRLFSAGKPVDYEYDTDSLDQQQVKCLRLAAFFKDLLPEEASEAMRALTYDNKTRITVRDILRYKDWPVPPDRRFIKRALREMGPEILSLVWSYKTAARKADDAVKAGELRCFEMRDDQMLIDAIELTKEVLESGEPYQISMLDINGKDLIEAGIKPGEQIGRVLERLLDFVIEDPSLNRRERLLTKLEGVK